MVTSKRTEQAISASLQQGFQPAAKISLVPDLSIAADILIFSAIQIEYNSWWIIKWKKRLVRVKYQAAVELDDIIWGKAIV